MVCISQSARYCIKVRFNLKKPSSSQKRKSFAVIRDVVFEPTDRNIPKDKFGRPKKRDSTTVESHDIDAINEKFLSKELRFEEARRQLKSIVIPNLKSKEGPNVRARAIDEQMFLEDNARIFNDYWAEVYEDEENDNRETSNISAKNEFKKALALINPIPLQSVSKKNLKRKWDNLVLARLARRRYGTRINELAFFGLRVEIIN